MGGLQPPDDNKCNYSVTEKQQQNKDRSEIENDWTNLRVK